MTAVAVMNDDFLDTLLTDCEPDSASDMGYSPFEFPISSKRDSAYTSPSITPSIVAPTISPSQTKTLCGPIPEMELERSASPDSSAQNPGSPTCSFPSKRAFDDAFDNQEVLKVTIDDDDDDDDGVPVKGKKRKQEDRRERKNQREKQRRTELNALFDNMVDLLGLPKETKADKVTVLASAINTIRQLRSTMRPEVIQMVQERNLCKATVPETCEAAQQAVQKQQCNVAAPIQALTRPAAVATRPAAPVFVAPVHAAPVYLQQPAAPVFAPPQKASIEDLTYFDPCSVFSDM